jgi:hypothetical protein
MASGPVESSIRRRKDVADEGDKPQILPTAPEQLPLPDAAGGAFLTNEILREIASAKTNSPISPKAVAEMQ